MSRRRKALLLMCLCGAGLVWGGWAWWTDRLHQRAMAEIEAEILGGRYAIACRKLDQLLSWSADPKGGIVYLLGSCELARGRPKAAGEAWARVVPGTAFSDRAIRGRARLLRDSGQLAAAEQLILNVARDPRNDRTAVLELLVSIYGDQGRVEEAERIIEDRWDHLNSLGEGALEPAIKLVRQHVELTRKRTSVKADDDRLHARYLILHDRKQPIRDAVKLASLAEQLGRRFEARVFRAIAHSQEHAR
jgi:hypothetical protein